MSSVTTIATEQLTTRNVPSKPVWAGRIVTAIPTLFLLSGVVMDFVQPAAAVQGTLQLGYQQSTMTPIGFVLLACVILYLIPRTAILGAVLLTGYLGGAVATHVRASGTWFEILFPVLFGGLVWAGAYLREQRLRFILPVRS